MHFSLTAIDRAHFNQCGLGGFGESLCLGFSALRTFARDFLEVGFITEPQSQESKTPVASSPKFWIDVEHITKNSAKAKRRQRMSFMSGLSAVLPLFSADGNFRLPRKPGVERNDQFGHFDDMQCVREDSKCQGLFSGPIF